MDHVVFIVRGRWFAHEVYVTRISNDSDCVLAWFTDTEMWQFIRKCKVEVWVRLCG